MATQIFTLDWDDAPEAKSILTKQEVIDYCAHYGQNNHELHTFLDRFDFDAWKCMKLGMDYSYGRHSDKSGSVGNDPASFLNIIVDTFFSEKGDLALKKYLGFNKNKFEYPEEPQFVTFEDCPLWVIQVTEDSQFYTQGIIFMPAVFWEDATMDEESYAASPYLIESSYNSWYSGGYGKNPLRGRYRKLRIGSWSPNFLDRTKTDIEVPWKSFLDQQENKVLVHSDNVLSAFDLSTGELSASLPIDDFEFVTATETGYNIRCRSGMKITDKGLNELSKSKDIVVNEFHGDFWDVIINSKAILIKRKTDADYIKYKSSLFKLTTSTYKNEPDSLQITENGNNSLIIAGEGIAVVDPEMNVTYHNTKKNFEKAIAPFLGPSYFFMTESRLAISNDKQWFFVGEVLFEMGADETPKLLNEQLFKLTGEYAFHAGVLDEELKGIWLVAGLGRLVFVDLELENGFVFNFNDLNETERIGDVPTALFFDKDKNLWYRFAGSSLYKIGRSELKQKLETAIPFPKKEEPKSEQNKKSNPKSTSDMASNEKVRLTFSDGKSNKFWEIVQDGTSITTTYGKIDTDGQQSEKSFDTEEAATKERDKLIQQKIKKGYER